MANFQASLYNSGILAASVSGLNLVITDYSNYDTNSQFAQSEFISFRKIKVTQPDGTEHLFSSIGDGDAACITANGAVLPILDLYQYASGDGVYTFKLYVCPDWSASVAYSSVTADHVYYGGKIYKSIQSGTNHLPTDVAFWSEVTDIDSMGGNYVSEGKMAIVCDLQKCYISMMKSAVSSFNCFDCNNQKLCNNKDWTNAVELLLVLEAIQGMVNVLAWTDVTNLINRGRSICCCQ